jgi:hypothetical protein
MLLSQTLISILSRWYLSLTQERDILQCNDLPLVGLISKENNLVREIKDCGYWCITHLDVEMKKLIYENYSKFVFASKTLQNINSSCDVMITTLNDLSSRCILRFTIDFRISPQIASKWLPILLNSTIDMDALRKWNSIIFCNRKYL